MRPADGGGSPHTPHRLDGSYQRIATPRQKAKPKAPDRVRRGEESRPPHPATSEAASLNLPGARRRAGGWSQPNSRGGAPLGAEGPHHVPFLLLGKRGKGYEGAGGWVCTSAGPPSGAATRRPFAGNRPRPGPCTAPRQGETSVRVVRVGAACVAKRTLIGKGSNRRARHRVWSNGTVEHVGHRPKGAPGTPPISSCGAHCEERWQTKWCAAFGNG